MEKKVLFTSLENEPSPCFHPGLKNWLFVLLELAIPDTCPPWLVSLSAFPPFLLCLFLDETLKNHSKSQKYHKNGKFNFVVLHITRYM